MTIKIDRKVLKEAIRQELARQTFAGFTLYTYPGYQMGWVHEEICQKLDQFLDDVAHKKAPRLIIMLPPRSGKTELISRRFPAYLFGRQPDMSVIGTSYAADLANRNNRDIQRIMDLDQYRNIFPDSNLSRKGARGNDSSVYLRNADIFEVVGHKGSYRSAGVGGGITGMGGNCLTEDAKVLTPNGYVSITNILAGMPIIGYNEITKKTEICTVEKVRALYAEDIYKLCSNKGRSLKATGDHPIYSQGGYIAAKAIAAGAPLLCAVPQGICDNGVSVQKEDNQWTFARFLFSQMRARLGKGARNRKTQMCRMWRTLQKGREVLFEMPCDQTSVQIGNRKVSTAENRLPDLSKRIYGRTQRARSLRTVLLNELQGQSPFVKNEGRVQYALQEQCNRKAQSNAEGILCCQAFCFTKGYLLRNLWNNRKFAIPSRGFRPISQRNKQCCACLRNVPHRSSQARNTWDLHEEYIASNQKLYREKPVKVIDLQVSKCHNFFANGILVHNCLIIDDPLKDRAEADSPTIRQKVYDWYTSTLYTRLAPGGGILIVMTRWHTDDLCGRLLEHMQKGSGDKWDVVEYPAIATKDEPHRKQGEPLHPERYSLAQLLKIKDAVGSRDWEALYQQHPTIDGGTIIKKEWLKFYKILPDSFDTIITSWDMTFKDTNTSDFVVGQVWGRKGADCYLIDQKRGRMSFTETVDAFLEQANTYPKALRKLVEDKANGPAVIDVLKHAVQGIIPIEPDGSKIARAYAVTPMFEAGNIYLPAPEIAPWVNDYTLELLQFPIVAHDDQVDATTQALRDLQQHKKITINPKILRR